MIVNCDHHTCTSNIAGECVNVVLRLKDGECQSMEESSSTGEIIEQEPNKFTEMIRSRFNQIR